MFDQEAFTMPDSFNEDDIDIFAELGVTSGNPNNNPTAKLNDQQENLAILLSGNDMDEQKPSISEIESDLSNDNFSLPDETIGELLEILVKQELHSSEGKQIISNVLCLEDAPKSIPTTWIPLHDILRDILTKAMQMLSSTNFTIHNNA